MAPIALPVHQPFKGGPPGVKPMDWTRASLEFSSEGRCPKARASNPFTPEARS